MKKAIALLATLVVLTSTTFAQLAPTITGSAETKIGTNLTTERSGIELDSEVTVTVPLFTGEAATEGEGSTGSASITGASLTFTLDLDSIDGDDDFLVEDINDEDSALKGTEIAISAKLDFANGAYVTIGSGSDLEANFVDGDNDYWVKPSFDEKEAVSLGYATDMFSVELTLANEIDGFASEEEDNATDEGYRGDTDVIAEDKIVDVAEVTTPDAIAKEGGLFLGGKAMYTAGDIFTLDFAFATNSTGTELADTAKKTAVAFKATTMPMEGLTVTVPFDYLMADAGNAMELMPTVSYTTGALTLGTDFHYISVAKELDGGSAAVVANIPTGFTLIEIDGVEYLVETATGNQTLAEDNDDYIATGDARVAVAALTEDFIGQQLNATIGYALDAGAVSLTVGTALGQMDSDMDLSVEGSFTAADYSVTFDLGDVLHTDGMDDLELGATYTGVTGVSASLETTLSLDDARDNSEAFTLDALNVDFDSAITGLENTVITVNFSEFDAADAKGVFYVGAKITL